MEHYIWKTKVLDGSMSLGRGNIDSKSLTVDSAPLPKTMTVDYVAGMVRWTNVIGDPGPYLFEFDYTIPDPPAATKTTEETLSALVDKLVEKEIITVADKDDVTTISAEVK